MNSLIITNTHILFGEWSSIKGNYILNDLKYVALSKPIREVLKSQNTIRTVLKEALDNFPVSGNHVAIAIDDSLLYHDKFTCEESLTKSEIWDYIQWEAKQKWGELGNYYTTFAEIDSPNPNALHTITCPAFLVSEIKALITNKGGKPIWAGPLSTIYLESSEYRNAIYMTDDDAYIKFFYRGRDGYNEGKLRFIAGQPNVTVGIGNKEEQNNLFSTPNDAMEIVTIDLISDTKNTHLRQFKYKRIIPFEGIEVKIDDIPEDLSFKLLNALSIMIRDFSFDNLVDFFNPSKIQDKKYAGIGKISFNSKGERVEVIENDTHKEPDLHIKRKNRKKKVRKAKEKRNNKVLLPFLLVILFGLLGYYLFYTEIGKNLLLDIKEKIGLTKSEESSDSLIFFNQQFNQSTSLIKTYSALSSIVSPDSIISLTIADASGSIAFVGKDSLDIPNFRYTHYSIESIDCCGGVKHKVDFDIMPLPSIMSNIWLNPSDITIQLHSSLGVTKIRRLDLINENGTKYSPIIFEVDSLSQIDNTIQYLKFVADNVIVRKIDITNTPPNNNYTGKFYIAVFEPL
ncbi:hypothetical protein ACFL4B_01755 [Candidatus Neomarinimicrobiota bacterium]